jgi:hypothetical protein
VYGKFDKFHNTTSCRHYIINARFFQVLGPIILQKPQQKLRRIFPVRFSFLTFLDFAFEKGYNKIEKAEGAAVADIFLPFRHIHIYHHERKEGEER